jgi:hypothetical protein
MDITGKIIVLEDTVQVSEKFRKREFVIEYADNPQYPEYIKFEMVQDKCTILDNFAVDQEVQVFFDLRGRKWVDRQGQTKYFNSLQAWRLNPAGSAPQQQASPQVFAEDPTDYSGGVEEVDNIPF